MVSKFFNKSCTFYRFFGVKFHPKIKNYFTSTAHSGSLDDPSGLVALDVKVLLDDQLSSLQIESVHLVDGLHGQLLCAELEDAAATRLVVLVAEQFDVSHVADVVAKHVL